MTKDAFLNAIIAVAAVGGSTNSVVHLLAIAGRLGIDLTLEDFDAAGAGVPVMANLQPSGTFLMDDLYRAGRSARAAHAGEGPPPPRADHGDRHAARRLPRRPPGVRRHGDLPARDAADGGCRHRGAARQPRPARRDHQARRGDARAAAARRTRGRLRLDRRHARAHRRPRPRRHRRLGAGAARLRPARLPRDAGGRQHAAAARSCSSRACATWCASATRG